MPSLEPNVLEFAMVSLRSRLLQLRETIIFQFSFTPEEADKLMDRLNETLRYAAGIDVVGGSYDPIDQNDDQGVVEPLEVILDALGERGVQWFMTKDEDFGYYAYWYQSPESGWVDARGYGTTEEEAIRDLHRDVLTVDYEWEIMDDNQADDDPELVDFSKELAIEAVHSLFGSQDNGWMTEEEFKEKMIKHYRAIAND